MSASYAITRHLGRFVSQQCFRRAVCSGCAFRRPIHLQASLPLVPRRWQSGDRGKPGDKEASYDGWQDKDNTEAKDGEQDYEDSVKQKILNAALNHVLEYGWSKQALEAGATSEGLPPVAHGMFERGGVEIVEHLYRKLNAELVENMKQEGEKHKAEGAEKPKTTALIRDAVETRLRLNIPYMDIWKEAMALQALPQNAPHAWKNLMNLSDDIWYQVGDRSTNFDWYTKRLSLCAVYKATEIYMLQDTSDDYANTWQFLDSRLKDLNQLGNFRRSMGPLGEGILGLLSMGRNILGMNSRNR